MRFYLKKICSNFFNNFLEYNFDFDFQFPRVVWSKDPRSFIDVNKSILFTDLLLLV